jgi:hypothetical protein
MKGLWAIAAVTLVAAAPATVEAQFFSENFDSYLAGSQIGGQGGWELWDNNPAANTTVSNAQSFTSPNSLLIAGGADVVRRFTGVNSGIWYAKARIFVPSTSTGEVWFIMLNRYAPLATNNNWSVQLVSCVSGCTTAGALPGMAVNLGGSGNPGTGSAPLITDQWVDVRVEINLTSNTYNLFYNHVLIDTKPWQVGGVNEVGAFDLFSNGASQGFMDDIWLDPTIPVELTTFTIE